MPHKDLEKRREYHRLYLKNIWYPKNREVQHAYVKKSREKLRNIVKQIKNVPCQDCGKKYPSYVMEFDHVRGKKLKHVADIVKMGQHSKTLNEIKKCDIVCANCHRIRTYKRLGKI